LLAGGSGSRARPFTDYVPKAMFPLYGRPIIDYLVRYIAQFSQISEIIIICNFDRFGKQIINYFEGKQSIVGKPITFVEDKKNGTGGSLLKIEKYVRHDECFLVWFADNLCALNIEQMIQKYHQVKNMKSAEKGTIGIVVVRKRRREETARVILDDSQIKEFMEKEMVKLEQPEALGIYLFSKRIFQYLHERLKEGFANFNLSYDRPTKNVSISTFDLSHDVLSQIPKTENLFSYEIGDDTQWIDAESPAHLDRNRDIVEKILSQMHSVSGD
jgi:mannose-1-phosphate guanylyltransferase